jgi:hypothetical protein
MNNPDKAIYRIDIGPYFYLGSAYNISSRLKRHKNLLEKNKHGNKHMQSVFNKLRVFSYKIVEKLQEDEDQFEIEQIYLDLIDFNDRFTLNKSFVARGMNSEMAKDIFAKHSVTMINNLNSKSSISKRNKTNRSTEKRKEMSLQIKDRWKDPSYRSRVTSQAGIKGRFTSISRYGYKGIFPLTSEYRVYLSETFVEYYKAFGLKNYKLK